MYLGPKLPAVPLADAQHLMGEFAAWCTNALWLGSYGISFTWESRVWQMDSASLDDMTAVLELLKECDLFPPVSPRSCLAKPQWSSSLSWLGLLPSRPSGKLQIALDGLTPAQRRELEGIILRETIACQTEQWRLYQLLSAQVLKRREKAARYALKGKAPPRVKPLFIPIYSHRSVFPPSEAIHGHAIRFLKEFPVTPTRKAFDKWAITEFSIAASTRHTVWLAVLAAKSRFGEAGVTSLKGSDLSKGRAIYLGSFKRAAAPPHVAPLAAPAPKAPAPRDFSSTPLAEAHACRGDDNLLVPPHADIHRSCVSMLEGRTPSSLVSENVPLRHGNGYVTVKRGSMVSGHVISCCIARFRIWLKLWSRAAPACSKIYLAKPGLVHGLTLELAEPNLVKSKNRISSKLIEKCASHDLTFIPVELHHHWVLAIVNRMEATITLLNSSTNLGNRKIAQHISKAFNHGHRSEVHQAFPSVWSALAPPCRQQISGSNDCGPHLVLNLAQALCAALPAGSLPPSAQVPDSSLRLWLISLLRASENPQDLPRPWPLPAPVEAVALE